MALGSNQPQTEMSAVGLTTLPTSCAECLETLRAGTGIALSSTCSEAQ